MKSLIKKIISPMYRMIKYFYLKIQKGQISNQSISVNENGFLYIVTGEGYAQECLFSIKSLKKYNNEKICVFSEEKYRSMFEDHCDYFFIINSKLKRPKVEYISQSPFENTVYLDSDTFINENISDLFQLLNKYDFAGVFCNSRKRENYSKLISKYEDIPYSFSEVNTGVMVFNNSVQVKDLFKKWNEYYYKYLPMTTGWDQPSFRVALWESEVKLCHLPPEYNVRPKSVYEKVRNNKSTLGQLHMQPRIFHAHYSPEVHQGKFEIKTLSELHKKILELSIDITY
ncbi:putative nucleotide-diphospho-sugar transferase [Pelagibacteraceae bacterium]|nr:putative nucleotide-diphospho-sugar transferase [Pelagibacteraceae bacterium]